MWGIHSYLFLEKIPLQQEAERLNKMKVMRVYGKSGAQAGESEGMLDPPSPAGKNLASSVSAPFCFRAFRPGPRFSFLVGSNLRPMTLGKRKMGVAHVGKGKADRRLGV